MSPSNNSDITIGHWFSDTDTEYSIPHEQLFRHTAIIGGGGIGKSTHQINVMKQLAETGHGFCYINSTKFDIETLRDVLPDHRKDITTIRDPDHLSAIDFETVLKNGNILIIERNAFHQHTDQYSEMITFHHDTGTYSIDGDLDNAFENQYTQFLQEFWNTIRELDLDEHSYALFIDGFHRMADADVNYSDMFALARGEGLAFHINSMHPSDIPSDVRDALFSQVETFIAQRYTAPADVELLSERTGLPSKNFTNLGRFKAWVDTPRTDDPMLVNLSNPTQEN